MLSHDDYVVAWICALPIEMAAARAMLDDIHESLPRSSKDSNTYTLGNIGKHNIVVACLPFGQYGTNNAATVGNNIFRSFPCIQIGLVVGVGGGVPQKDDIRLGDVVVGKHVVQYDLVKTVGDGQFHRIGTPRIPPHSLLTAVAKLQAVHESEPSKIPSILSAMVAKSSLMTRYGYPGASQDGLFDSEYEHDKSMTSCERCDVSRQLKRPVRINNDPKVHHGNIGSGNQVIKHGVTRDRLAQELDLLCFEMEGAGLVDIFPCLVIRGICDYADSHKSKQWQPYAASTAAAYAKELLSTVPVYTSGMKLRETRQLRESRGASCGGDARGGDARGGDARGGDARGGDARGGDAHGGRARAGDARGGNAHGEGAHGGDACGGDAYSAGFTLEEQS